MFAEDFEIEALELMQQADMALIAAQKKAAELPQRAAIAAIAEKKKAVREKYSQVSKMSDAVAKQLERKAEEERLLKEKIDFTQGKIDEASGNFRQIESLTKDLAGLRERLDSAEMEHLSLEEKAAEVDKMIDQIDVALKTLADQESEQKKSFDAEASKIAAFVKSMQDKKKAAAASINRTLLTEYVNVQKQCGGVAMSRLDNGHCSACRQSMDGRISAIKKQAPLAKCPLCGRIMVVDE